MSNVEGPLITLIFSATLCALLMPWFIRTMKEKGVVVKDYYKKDDVDIATNAGILTLFVVLTTIILIPLVFRLLIKFEIDPGFARGYSALDNAILMTILLYAFYGVLDDYINVGRLSKMVIPLMFAYPLVLVLTGWDPWVPFAGTLTITDYRFYVEGIGTFTGSMFLRYIIAPVYIMVMANLKNMHSGFNGLQSGAGLLVLGTLYVKAMADGSTEHLYTISAVLGALIIFFFYNMYPAKIIEGNIGSLYIGAAIGGFIVVQGYLWAGFVMLIPHTINFILYVFWRVMRKLHPEDERWGRAKFGKVREDGSIEVPNRLTLKWVLPYYFRMT